MGYVLPILKSNPAFCSCLQLLQQLPAERVEQKEIDPGRTHGPQIHLRQPGAALPARRRRPSECPVCRSAQKKKTNLINGQMRRCVNMKQQVCFFYSKPKGNWMTQPNGWDFFMTSSEISR